MLAGVAALVDFSVPEAVPGTARAAAELSLPLVIGTTGWQDRIDEVRAAVAELRHRRRVGLELLARASTSSTGSSSRPRGSSPGSTATTRFIQDWHHRFKQDSPSGTALEIQRRMAPFYGEREIPITCLRAGYVPSVHAVGFDSAADTLHFEHRARNRQGLAEGALLAAGWIAGRSGFHEFREVMDDLLAAEPQP